MRTIEFRGYSPDRGWVFGDLLQRPNGDVYINERSDSGFLSYLVRPETVGQYTGLEDARGNKVYEGDIIRHSISTQQWGIFHVQWDEYTISWATDWREPISEFGDILDFECRIVVLGNVHDNPELLER